ncbi:MAG TPA: phosphatase PAP2 family protein [Clostridia bacterium]|nr:phosphatase PAP2 family protein [Clostridia bacterium]
MEVIQFIQRIASPFWDGFFETVTMLGEEYFYIVMLSLIYWCVDKRYGYKLSFALLFSGVLNGVVKSIVQAPRPIGTEGIRSLRVETATGTSFPSGHTQNASAFLVSAMKRLQRPWAYAAGCLLILLVGVSRLYLGVHWPIDVLGGIALGTGAVVLADFVFEWAARKENKWLPLFPLIPAVAAAIAWRGYADLVKTTATFSGFLIGYAVETSLIRFDEKAPLWKQAVKFALGFALTLALKQGLKSLFPQTSGFDFLRYAILGLWITVGAPVVFSALRLSVAGRRAQREPAQTRNP